MQPGDSLSAIAARELGDAGRWPEIFALNRDLIGADPGQIQVGMELRLPGGVAPSPPPPDPPAPPGAAGELSQATLQQIMPNLPDDLAARYIGPLNQVMGEYGINTPERQAAFLARAEVVPSPPHDALRALARDGARLRCTLYRWQRDRYEAAPCPTREGAGPR